MRDVSRLRQIPHGQAFFIYGAGGAGRILLERLKEHFKDKADALIAGFIDAEKTGDIDGFPIIRLEQAVEKHNRDIVVIIASQHWESIAKLLKRYGVHAVYNAYPLIARILVAQNPASERPAASPYLIIVSALALGVLALLIFIATILAF